MNKRQRKKFYKKEICKFLNSHLVKYCAEYPVIRKEDIIPQIPKKPEKPYFPFEHRYLIIDGKEVIVHAALC